VTGASNNDWDTTIDDLDQRRERARAMGGAERLQRHRIGGKLDARARIHTLLDSASFRELGTLVGGDTPADGIVAGSGLIDGRPVMVGAEDFTTLAGTIGLGSNSKRYRLAELALLQRIPLVMLLEGAGYRAGERGRPRTPVDLILQARCSGSVPVVTGVLGASAGHGALIAPMSDFSVMTQEAAIFTAGPPVVRDSTGEEVTKEQLGGPAVAVPSGVVHNLATDDTSALIQIRGYLSYFPSSAWSYPPLGESAGPRPTPELRDVVPRDNRRVYDMREVLDSVLDSTEWFEVRPSSGASIICALAHLGGEPVAVVANQPNVLAGAIDTPAAEKASHFITVADSFHLPLVFLSDNPGILPGSQSERAGVLRAGARLFAAQTSATTIKLHLTLRKGYGFGSMVMAMASFDGQAASFAYPGATLGAMGATAQGRALGADDDVTAALRQAELAASYDAAENLRFDELIDPTETRNALLDALQRALFSRQKPPGPVARVGIRP
jgi:acetyl-CoA carboxylase carboxyltransferase component